LLPWGYATKVLDSAYKRWYNETVDWYTYVRVLVSCLSISLLGPLYVALNDKPVTHFRGDTVQALLAYLAMHAGFALSRGTLAGLLWPDLPEAKALRNLRQALFRLRAALADDETDTSLLNATRTTLALDPVPLTDASPAALTDFGQACPTSAVPSEWSGPCSGQALWVDVTAFTQAIADAETHVHRRLEDCASCVQRLAQAVKLYRGEFLQGFSVSSALFEQWMVVERERLHEQALAALGTLADYYEEHEQYEQAIAYARRQVALEPWRESAHRQWIRALALSGQREAALFRYKECRSVLKQELGVEPSPETKALYDRIARGDDLAAGRPAPRHNLPAQLAPLVGREMLLAEIVDRIRDPAYRLLTLAGPGGAGKTRLALEAAWQIASASATSRSTFEAAYLPERIYFVSLAPLRSVEAIVLAIAQALEIPLHRAARGSTPDSRRQLLAYLRPRSVLLVLDNVEHLLAEHLPAGHLPAEHLLDVVDLTLDILRAAPKVKIMVTSRVRLNAASECLIPVLGMEVPPTLPEGAVQAGQYDAIQLYLSIAQRVRPGYRPTNEDLAHVVEICRAVNGMPRAILLAAAWMDVLSPAEIARDLAPQEEPEATPSVDFLAADLRDIPDRQRSMRTVFDHSWDLLPAPERGVMRALSVFRGSLTREAARSVTGASLRTLRTLVDRSLLHPTAAGRYEVHELLRQYAEEKLNALPDERERINDRHCAYYVDFLYQRESDIVTGYVQETMREIDNVRAAWEWATRCGKAQEIVRSAVSLWFVYNSMAWHQEGAITFGRAAESLRTRPLDESGDTRDIALGLALGMQSFFSRYTGDVERAEQLTRESLSILEPYGTRRELALSKWFAVFGHPAQVQRNRQLLEECLALSEETGFYIGRLLALRGLKRYEEALALCRAANDLRGSMMALGYLGRGAYARREYVHAVRFLKESLALAQEVGVQRIIGEYCLDLGDVTLAQGKYEAARRYYEKALAECEQMGQREGVLHAHNGLARVAWVAKDQATAARHLGQALQIAVQNHFDAQAREAQFRLNLVVDVATLLAAADGERAVELAALVHRHPAGTAEARQRARALLDQLQATLSPARFALAQERGRSRDLEATIQELNNEWGS
jgi:DNA-binding SARP family transcriptional activator/predicted ATPase